MSRMEKVNHQVLREISEILHTEVGDPRLKFVTITQVDVSKDLRNARIYYSVLGDDKKQAGAQKAFDSARGLIRRLLAARMTMRYTPELTFSYDKGIEYSDRIEQKLKEIQGELSSHHENH